MFLQNIGIYLQLRMVLQHRRSTWTSLPLELQNLNIIRFLKEMHKNVLKRFYYNLLKLKLRREIQYFIADRKESNINVINAYTNHAILCIII
jgi:hypothetical protein